MRTIAIVGAGQIGSRHLQALARIESALHIQVLDPSASALAKSKERWLEAYSDKNNFKVDFIQHWQKLHKRLDVAIISTNSINRLAALREVTKHCVVKFIVFEKFLFSKSQEYLLASQILIKHRIDAYVNCPRRLYPYYNKIKKEISRDNLPIRFSFEGSRFGLSSNTIHRMDLFAYFLGHHNFDLDMSQVNQDLQSSERPGYLEMTGRIIARTDDGNLMEVTSYPEGDAPNLISITNAVRRYFILESLGYYYRADASTNWEYQKVEFQIPFQSTISDIFVSDLLLNGKCELTNFDESSLLHQQFLSAALPFYNIHQDLKNEDPIPIT